MAIDNTKLQNIVKTSLDTAIFISTATAYVNNALQDAGLDSTTKENITLYVAAHLVVLSEEFGGLRRSRLGEADESYKVPGDKDTMLASTRFGQAAMMLDASGTLAGLSSNGGVKALFSVIQQERDGYDEAPNVYQADL